MICRPPVCYQIVFLIFERMAVLAMAFAFIFEFQKIDSIFFAY